jgi:hypothetical protein
MGIATRKLVHPSHLAAIVSFSIAIGRKGQTLNG